MYFCLRNSAIFIAFCALTIAIVQSNDKCDCGLLNVQSRISHGFDANPHKYPWVAFIKIFNNATSKCTGSLIDDRTILTAAHCVEKKDGGYVHPSRLLVFLGITTKKDAYNDIGRRVEDIIVHPGRNVTYFENDIALLHLKIPVKPVKNIRPVCLPANRDESVFRKLKVAGFGRLSEEKEAFDLQEADIDYIDHNTCYQKASDYYKKPRFYFSKTTICGQGKDRTSICSGDSGGPLMHSNKDGRMVIAGVSQFVRKKCGADTDLADHYANIGLFTDFIKKHAPNACFVPLS